MDVVELLEKVKIAMENKDYALFYAYPRLTHQWHVLLDQPIQLSDSRPHFNQCPLPDKSSHVQQCGYDQCGHEHQW